MRNNLISCLVATLVLMVAHSARGGDSAEISLTERAKPQERDVAFGIVGLIDTASGINADRPSVSSLFSLSPQLKLKTIYVFQLNMGFMAHYLDRAPNPWDLTDWSVQFSDLRIFKDEKHTGLEMSGNLRYYIPLSVASRNADSRGALRLLLKLHRPVWKFDFGGEVSGRYNISKYTTTDSARWQDDDKMMSNGMITFGEKLFVTLSPIESLTFGMDWTFYQDQEYPAKPPETEFGSSYLHDKERKSDVWESSWAFGASASYSFLNHFSVEVGYMAANGVLDPSSRGTHYNPFDARIGQVYLDLMATY